MTGFGDAGQNFIAGLPSAEMKLDMLWDATTTTGDFDVMRAFPTGVVTLLPEGYPALGANTISLAFLAGNYAPSGKPDGAIQLGSIACSAYGPTAYLERGWALAHGIITNTLTGTGLLDPWATGDLTEACSGVLHIWDATATDTYVVKIQHCDTLAGVYTDLITFTLNGTAIGSERITVASGTVHKYRRVLATRTGAGDTFGFTVSFTHQ